MTEHSEIAAMLAQPLTLGRGRRNSELKVEKGRDLSVEDLVTASTQAHSIAPVTVKELRQSHHRLAKVLAQGTKPQEAAVICGYSISRISILKGDPAFQELLAFYENMEEVQYSIARADMHERLASLGFDSLELLHERVLDAPESFDNKTLLAVVEASADRTGHGKTSTVNHDHTHALSSDTIAQLKKAVGEGVSLAPEDRGALLRLAASRTAPDDTPCEEADWEPSTGSLLREEGDPLHQEQVPPSEPEVP